MGHLARAAAYLAAWSSDGRRAPGPDEDLFTILATALERANDGRGDLARPVEIEVDAPIPESMDWAFGAIVGSPATIVHVALGPDSFATALRRAEEGEEGDRIALVASWSADPPDSASLARSRGGAGTGAAAFLFQPGPGRKVSAEPVRSGSEGSSLGTAFELYQRTSGLSGVSWVGDWKADPGQGRPGDPARLARYRDRPISVVSEGAYVPRPRYRDSLPSRWRFAAERCPDCSKVTFPSRGSCRSCGNLEGLVPILLPRDGLEVIATTVIGPGGQPTEFDPQVAEWGPYEVLLVELAPGARATLQLTDAEPGSVRIGDRVDTRLRRLYPMEGEWRYARKAVPRTEM
ncbi:MAG TPA: hypothetical protein VEK13_03080 [Thermoplasmata archaeon]|nr:hypothetical protein [Thermoplasmata archaeon]